MGDALGVELGAPLDVTRGDVRLGEPAGGSGVGSALRHAHGDGRGEDGRLGEPAGSGGVQVLCGTDATVPWLRVQKRTA